MSVSKNIFWLSVSRLTAIVMVFFAYAYLLKYLGVSEFGKYQFILSYTTLFGVIVDLGLSQYVVKKISEDLSRAKTYFHTFFVAEVGLSLLVYAAMVSIAAARGLESDVFQGIAVAGVGVALAGLTMPFLSVLSAYQDLRKVALINFCSSLVNVTIIVITITSGKGIVFLALNLGIAQSAALGLYYRFIKKYFESPELLASFSAFDKGLLKQIAKAALPFTLLVGFSTIYNRIDTVIIFRLLGAEATGLYGAAYKVVDLLNFFPAVVSHSLYPAFAALMASGAIADVRTMLEKYLRFLIAIAVPLGVGGTLLASHIVLVLSAGDTGYLPAALPLAVLVWAVAILFIYIPANALVISQLTKYAVIITGVNVIINIVGNVLLLPHIGIRAAAILTVVSESLQALFYFYFISRYITRFNFFGFLVKPFFAAACMGFALWYLRGMRLVEGTAFSSILINFALVVVAAGALYVALLSSFKFFRPGDLAFIKTIFKRSV